MFHSGIAATPRRRNQQRTPRSAVSTQNGIAVTSPPANGAAHRMEPQPPTPSAAKTKFNGHLAEYGLVVRKGAESAPKLVELVGDPASAALAPG
jgi:hypothetical protein